MTALHHHREILAALLQTSEISRVKDAASRRRTDGLSMRPRDTYTWRAYFAQDDRAMTIRARLLK